MTGRSAPALTHDAAFLLLLLLAALRFRDFAEGWQLRALRVSLRVALLFCLQTCSRHHFEPEELVWREGSHSKRRL